jgi:predicted esterase
MMKRAHTLLPAAAALPLLAVLVSPTAADAQLPSGWSVIDLPGLTEYHLYLPASIDQEEPSPLIVFLHGAGSAPDHYRGLLSNQAIATGAVLALPKSTSPLGWGAGQDQALVEATISSVQDLVAINPAHMSISGHSAGGAYAYLLAYGTEIPFSSVFTLAAPFQPITSLTGTYVPPIRLFYGTNDPNFLTALPQLTTQWTDLGVEFEVEELQDGGHNDIPTSTVLAGFDFMLSKERVGVAGATCETDDEQLCVVGGRFKVTVSYTNANGAGIGRVAEMRSPGSGLFWFFSPLNWELLVKVLDGCSFNQHYWVLIAASTDLSYSVTVTDLRTGEIKTYGNELGTAAPAVVDLDAFATCSS